MSTAGERPKISLVVAMARNGVIGAQGKLPWHLPEDLKRFRAITTGHPIILGRKTFDSIGRALPNRTNIVITRDPQTRFEGCEVAHGLEEAIALGSRADVPGHDEIFVIGGGEIYRQALPMASRIYLTLIEQEFPGDAFFPDLDEADFHELSRERKDEPISYSYLVLERIKFRS